jgi:hypothetical protein
VDAVYPELLTVSLNKPQINILSEPTIIVSTSHIAEWFIIICGAERVGITDYNGIMLDCFSAEENLTHLA